MEAAAATARVHRRIAALRRHLGADATTTSPGSAPAAAEAEAAAAAVAPVAAPTDLAAQLECLDRDGAVVIPNAFSGQLLEQIRDEYYARWEELRYDWGHSAACCSVC